jgi:hypothetical protein
MMIMKLGEMYKVFKKKKKKSDLITTLEIFDSWTVCHSTRRRGWEES